jgi:nucleotide-binding universal stress UspA family protein
MTYKSIVLPVISEQPGKGAAIIAAALARVAGGVLRLLYPRGESVENARFRYPTLGDSFFVQVEEASRELAESRERETRAKLEETVADCWLDGIASDQADGDGAVPHLRWEPVDADPPDAIRLQGGLYDLLVMDDAGRADRELVDAALFQTGRPVLLAPDERAPIGNPAIPERAMIGWNRSAEAGRAVVTALPLLQMAKSVVICAIRTAAKQGPSPSQLAEYLAHHSVAAEIIRPDPKGAPIGEVLLDAATENGADLLIAGANYGTRLREVMPGGVTAQLLRHARLPVLLSH